jgi:hypothetical protein
VCFGESQSCPAVDVGKEYNVAEFFGKCSGDKIQCNLFIFYKKYRNRWPWIIGMDSISHLYPDFCAFARKPTPTIYLVYIMRCIIFAPFR